MKNSPQKQQKVFFHVGEAVILDSEPYVKYLFEDVLYNSFTRFGNVTLVIKSFKLFLSRLT